MKVCERIYSFILKFMKFFGMYFGDIWMEKFKEVVFMLNRIFLFLLLCCVVVMICFWFNVIMVFVSFCMEGILNFFFFFCVNGNFFMWFKNCIYCYYWFGCFFSIEREDNMV